MTVCRGWLHGLTIVPTFVLLSQFLGSLGNGVQRVQNNNDNNNRISIAQVCRLTRDAGRMLDSYSHAIQLELGLDVWRKTNVCRLCVNRARELQHREFQMATAEHWNTQPAKWVLVVGLCSSGVVKEQRWRVDSWGLMSCGNWGMQELMCFLSCTSGRQACRSCSQCIGELAVSVTVPAVVAMVSVTVPAERFMLVFSMRCGFWMLLAEALCNAVLQ